MILEAIDALDNDNGSNKTAISGYLKGKYGARLPTDHTSLLTTNLGRMKSSGEIVFARNNYFRPDGDDEEVEGAPADPASPLRPDRHEDPAVAEDSTGVFDMDSFFLDDGDDGLLAPPLGDAAEEIAVPAPAPGVAADEIAVPAPAPGVAADDIDAPAPAPAVTADAVAEPPKRGRGRPPKPKDPVAEPSVVATDATAVPAK